MLFALACGCDGGETGAPSSEPVSQAAQADNSEPVNASSPSDPEPVEYELGQFPVGLPLVDEKVSFSIWMEDRPFLWNWIESYDQNVSYAAVEEATNINVDWYFFSISSGAEKFQIMVAGGEWPDMIFNGSAFYPSGVSKGYEDGVFLKLNDLAEQHLPNYMAYLDSDPDLKRDALMDNGDMLCVVSFTEGLLGLTGGMYIRDDLVTALGHEIISMGGNSIYKELLESQGYDVCTATTSAFVQQREKLLLFAFEFLLREFTDAFADTKKYRGYRLFAVDGSDLHISANPLDSDIYYQCKPSRNGYNLLHLNALFDLCSRIYVDALVQPGKHQNEPARC